MSYAWVNQGLAEGKQQGTLGALQDRSTEEKGSTRVNQEEGQKALDDVRRIITRGSVSRPKSLGGLVEERRNDKTATPLAKLKSELSEARERGELIGDNVCHTRKIESVQDILIESLTCVQTSSSGTSKYTQSRIRLYSAAFWTPFFVKETQDSRETQGSRSVQDQKNTYSPLSMERFIRVKWS